MRSTFSIIVAASAAAALLASCAAGPDYQRPALPLPAQYPGADAAGVAGTEVPAQWWTLYGQPELDRLVAQALERNRDIEQAVARVEQADALARQAGAALLPRVDLGASAGRRSSHRLAWPEQPDQALQARS